MRRLLTNICFLGHNWVTSFLFFLNLQKNEEIIRQNKQITKILLQKGCLHSVLMWTHRETRRFPVKYQFDLQYPSTFFSEVVLFPLRYIDTKTNILSNPIWYIQFDKVTLSLNKIFMYVLQLYLVSVMLKSKVP